MANLDHLWVIHTTSNEEDAGTDEGFRLGIRGHPNPQAITWLDFPDLPHDERERGRTDEYRLNIRESDTPFPMDTLSVHNFVLAIKGDDAWLPASIWIIGEDVERNRGLLVAIPRWPSNLWFSTDPSEGKSQRSLVEGMTS